MPKCRGKLACLDRQALTLTTGGVGGKALNQAATRAIAIDVVGLIWEERCGVSLPGGVEIPMAAKLECGRDENAATRRKQLTIRAQRSVDRFKPFRDRVLEAVGKRRASCESRIQLKPDLRFLCV